LPEAVATRLETQIVAPLFRYRSATQDFNPGGTGCVGGVGRGSIRNVQQQNQPGRRALHANSAL
jgi:hypothetical protein